ncbi:hypothetical protein [Mammaliicoccus lentus]|uniref:hypothetical protein n=1 Tax=Mammaliicoccus lentus TaxID=42858 RepID=UPI00374ECA9F
MTKKVNKSQEIKDMLIQTILLIDPIHYSKDVLESRNLEEVQKDFDCARKQQLEEE